MDRVLQVFCTDFAKSFQPSTPARGKLMTAWLVSRVWSKDIVSWLAQRYHVRWNLRVPAPNRRYLDAALWLHPPTGAAMDIALEWEWDNNKVAREFPYDDFLKVLSVDARNGLAIVQTRVDGGRGPGQADQTIQRLRSCFKHHRQDPRSVVVIEIRRVRQTAANVEFGCIVHDLDLDESQGRRLAHWRYP